MKLDFTDEKFYILHISKVIGKLTDVVCNIDGEIETEEDFNNNIKWKERTDENNSIVWTNVAPEGVTFATVESKQAEMKAEYDAQDYSRKRAAAYPSIYDYMDGIVKNDQAQIDKYIADSQAVKARYPKGA